MSARKRRSKKRSVASSKLRPDEFVLYLDRNLGKHLIANALRNAGHRVEIHDDHLPIDAPDEDWISLVGTRRWVALNKDKNIRYRTAEIQAIKEHNARVIVVRAKNATGADIAEILIRSHERICRFAGRVPAPFVAGIDRAGTISNYEV
ncbi:MAG: hypothetical protein OEU36_22900 [Gammaproteobacteria bacterium]|nr:hypothetical protein [Gammaproteobacteria bacterium]